jgi:hypothetical protein
MPRILDNCHVVGQSGRFQKEHGLRLRSKKHAKTRENKFPCVRHVPCKESTQTQFKPERKFIKGQKKEKKTEVKNTSDRPRNHRMQDVSIRVRCGHIILGDPHSSEGRLSKMRFEFRELLYRPKCWHRPLSLPPCGREGILCYAGCGRT